MSKRRSHADTAGPSRRLCVEALESRRLLAAVCSSGRDNWTVGLVDCTSDASDGLTLVQPNLTSSAYLVDVHGRQVHSWTDGPYNRRFAAYVGYDGSLVSTGVTDATEINGSGSTGALWKQDWDGNITWNWTYSTDDFRLHHDIEPLPNGNVLAFAWARVSAEEMVAAGRDPEQVPPQGAWPERIMEIEPTGPTTGNIVWEWNTLDHVIQDIDSSVANFGVVADHPELIDINFGASGSDWMHFNAIDYNAELDQIVVTLRFFHEIWVIDHSTTTAEAATHSGGNSGMGGDLLYRWGNPQAYDRGGPDDQQMTVMHDAQWIDEGSPGAGNFLIFHNIGFDSTAELVEISPPVDGDGNYAIDPVLPYEPVMPTWTQDTGVVSPIMSGTQRMPNGNTLAGFASAGRIAELTPTGEEVWRYVNPDSGGNVATQGANVSGGPIFKARRYTDDFSGFAGHDLSADGYVENWLRGDYNLNGALDASDVDALCSGHASGDLIYDVNFDDALDPSDVATLVDQMGFLLGDANFDSIVDGFDFIIWNSNRFTLNDQYTEGDFNCDGLVDGLDFVIWNTNKFMSSGAPIFAAPESTREVELDTVIATLEPPAAMRSADDSVVPLHVWQPEPRRHIARPQQASCHAGKGSDEESADTLGKSDVFLDN